MKIKELIEKAMAEGIDKLTDDEKAQLTAYQDVDYEKLANDRAAKARREVEEKMAKIETARKALEDKLTEVTANQEADKHTKMTDIEKLTAKLTKLEADFKQADEERKKLVSDNANLIRSHKIDKVFAGIRLMDGVDPETARIALEHRLKEVDLDDAEMVNLKVQEFQQKNKAWISTGDKGGSGSGGGAGAGGTGGAGNKGSQDVDLDELIKTATNGDLAGAEKALKSAGDAVAGGKARIKGND